MDKNKRRKFSLLIAALLFTCILPAQQIEYYKVTGGRGVPVLADDNTNHRIQVYLVYGMENVQISYTSSSTSHQWCRYRTKPDFNNPEYIPSVQNGTTSTITDVEDGWGYYVDEGSMRRYVWIIDYRKYEFDIRSLRIAPDFEECIGIRFDGDADVEDMIYYTPTGTPEKVKRVFELSYETLIWDESTKRFSPEQVLKTFDTHPFATSFTPASSSELNFPLVLKDTEIRLTGDLFARHFGVEKSATIPFYEAKAIELHADTTITYSVSGGNVEVLPEELQAPAEITFRAYANTPVASLFTWRIFKDGNPAPEVIFNAEELFYTFNREGKYRITLEVSNRSGGCLKEYSVDIAITETVMEIPNAFSPGTTPGINDIFRVKYKSVMNFRGWIFNRGGTELFHWSDPSQGWDGKYRGKYVPAGAYYYLIEYTGTDGKKRVKKGDVNVFRTKAIDTTVKPVE
ncbi:MAG: gliding motility-associated C-terminal domain-containing protein [Tannerella sp.]|jgi:gliding motility-associated-like protein|nr:gliding motility-associated C-terminal domain-containing protein [Tannerella sp.]